VDPWAGSYYVESLTNEIAHKAGALIDEVEKSSSNLYNIWLNMLEEGEITLSSGEKVSCRNSIIIFTGNVGTKTLELRGNGIGFSKPDATQKRKQEVATVMAEVKKEFRPEFLNRISKVVVFNSLTEKELGQIFYLELGKVKDRIKENQGFNLYVSEKVKDLIVSKCELQYGARGLQRLITEYIEDNINLAMLHEDITGKNNIYLDVSKEDSEGIEVVFK
jgi:ATP-dependent Clp protease ATP-binding subunit ClpC